MLKLFLDDVRKEPVGWEVVRSYSEFVAWMECHQTPDVISFDHDLGFEHYPFGEQDPTVKIPYNQYTEKTGYHAAQWCIAMKRIPATVIVHSFNVVGARNIAQAFDRYTDARVIIQPYGR
jgi:hypothetical protein